MILIASAAPAIATPSPNAKLLVVGASGGTGIGVHVGVGVDVGNRLTLADIAYEDQSKKTHTYTGSRTDQKLLWYSRARYRLYPLMGTGWYQKLCKLALVLAC